MATQQWNGHARRQALAWVKATYTHCWLCNKPVNKDLPPGHNQAASADHIVPRSKGGALFDHANLQLAHRSCNSSRGNKPRTTTHSRKW